MNESPPCNFEKPRADDPWAVPAGWSFRRVVVSNRKVERQAFRPSTKPAAKPRNHNTVWGVRAAETAPHWKRPDKEARLLARVSPWTTRHSRCDAWSASAHNFHHSA